MDNNNTAQASRLSLAGFSCLLVVYLVWGSTYLGIRVAVREGSGFTPFVMGAMRVVVAGFLLVGWSALRKQRIRLNIKEAAILGSSGLLLWTGANGLVTWSEQHAHSGYAALMMGALPFWTALIEWVLDRKRPSLQLILSLLVGFSGLGLLTTPILVAGTWNDWTAVLALLAAPLCWSSGSLLQRRNPVKVSLLASSGYQQLFGGVGFVFLAILFREPLPTPTPMAWGAWGFLVVFGSLLGFTSFIQALRLLPTSIVMTYPLINPVIAVILGWIILSEPITLPVLGGMILILVGVVGVFRDRYGPTGLLLRSIGGNRQRCEQSE